MLLTVIILGGILAVYLSVGCVYMAKASQKEIGLVESFWPWPLQWGMIIFMLFIWPAWAFGLDVQPGLMFERNDQLCGNDPLFDALTFQTIQVVHITPGSHCDCDVMSDGEVHKLGERISIPIPMFTKKYFHVIHPEPEDAHN